MIPSAVIFGCAGPGLTSGEAAFFRDCDPWAFILFARNIETPNQVRRLCHDLRECVGRNALIFVDQEGGRVQRLQPPHWRKMPAARTFANFFKTDYASNIRRGKRAAWLNYRLIADELRSVGITANCAPVLDIPVPGADPIISDRAFSDDREQIILMAHAAMAGLSAGGIVPVIKHIPGHGRATVDSHKALPVINASIKELEYLDFEPFRRLRHAPTAMTGHVVLSDIDKRHSVTTSAKIIKTVIREKIGFDGLLMSDDLDMKALSGGLTERTEQALGAGCDVVLQCNGKLPNMVKVAKGVGKLSGKSLERAQIADNMAEYVESFDAHDAFAEYQDLMEIVDRFA
jgi:beta-N-acetylhexosaminidase